MNNAFLQREVINVTHNDNKEYKTNVIPRRDLIPWAIFMPKGFKEFKEDNDVKVIGTIKIGQKKYQNPLLAENSDKAIEEKHQKGIMGACDIPLSKTPSEYQKFDLYASTPRGYRCIGYASVGNDEYVKLVRTNPLWILSLLLIAVLIICGLKSCGSEPPKNPFNEVNGSEITTEAPDYNKYMANNHYLFVWRERTVTKEKPTVALVNHPKNDVYLCYDMVSEDGTTLDSTGAFKPNTQIDYDFYTLFGGKTGTHKITLLIKVYDLETKEELCSKTMPVEITIN